MFVFLFQLSKSTLISRNKVWCPWCTNVSHLKSVTMTPSFWISLHCVRVVRHHDSCSSLSVSTNSDDAKMQIVQKWEGKLLKKTWHHQRRWRRFEMQPRIFLRYEAALHLPKNVKPGALILLPADDSSTTLPDGRKLSLRHDKCRFSFGKCEAFRFCWGVREFCELEKFCWCSASMTKKESPTFKSIVTFCDCSWKPKLTRDRVWNAWSWAAAKIFASWGFYPSQH